VARKRDAEAERRDSDDWPPLADADLQTLLRQATPWTGRSRQTLPSIEVETKQKLAQAINLDIEARNRRRKIRQARLPSAQIEKLRRLQTKLESTLASLRAIHGTIGLDFEIGCASDWLKTREETGQADLIHIDEYLAFLNDRAKTSTLSISSAMTIVSAHAYIARLLMCVDLAEGSFAQGKNKHGRQQDRDRHRFVWDLATRYEDAFKLGAKATQDGPWVRFLAAVLSHLEGRSEPLSGDQAFKLWLSARRINPYVSTSSRFELRK
jgi:hypothetical protein